MPRIALIGDFHPGATGHQAIPEALALSAASCGCADEQIVAPLGPRAARLERWRATGTVHPLMTSVEAAQ
jgi:hypothetical protein